MFSPAVPSVDNDFDVIPYRFADSESRDAPSVRERALWCAVLEQAFIDLSNPTAINAAGAKYGLRRDAKRFLLRSRDLDEICELAGVNTGQVRKAARLMESGHLAFYIPPCGKQRSRNRD